MTEKLMILRLDPQEKPIYFAVPTTCDLEGVEFYVHEHTCPVNLFVSGCEAIIVVGDADPHGLFRFVKLMDRPKQLDELHMTDELWADIVPEAF